MRKGVARISEGQRSARQPPIVSFRGGNLLGQSNSYRRKDEKSLLGTIPRGDDFYVETQVLLLLGSQGGIYLGFTTTQSGYSGLVPIFVGSEEARCRAGLRPPLKLHVQFSRMQLSRRFIASEMPTKELTQRG